MPFPPFAYAYGGNVPRGSLPLKLQQNGGRRERGPGNSVDYAPKNGRAYAWPGLFLRRGLTTDRNRDNVMCVGRTLHNLTGKMGRKALAIKLRTGCDRDGVFYLPGNGGRHGPPLLY